MAILAVLFSLTINSVHGSMSSRIKKADWITMSGAELPTKSDNVTGYYMVLTDSKLNKQYLYISTSIWLNSTIYEDSTGSDVQLYS